MRTLLAFLKHKLVENMAAMYGVQFSRKLLPLASVPYLARTLGPAGWGTVAFVGALGELIVLLIEFGFNLSATREIARHRDSRGVCSEVMAGVLGAQIGLAVLGVALALLAARWIPLLRDNPRLLLAGLFYALAQGFLPLWFFQGLERMRVAAALEISGKIVALAGLFIFVHAPADGWKVLALQGLAPALSSVAGIWLAYRAIPFRAPSLELVREALRTGWPMFLFRGGESLYGAGNAFILGLFAPPVVVGYFSSAEKMGKAAFGLLNPIREALYPRLSHLAIHNPARGASLARLGAVVMGLGGLFTGGLLYLAAPVLIRILMGHAFDPAVQVLRILSVLPFLLSFTYSIGLQWLWPLGRDGVVNRIILMAGVLNVCLAFLLARRFMHLGMAWSVVASETFVCVCLVTIVVRSTAFFDSPLVSRTRRSPLEVEELAAN
ncbi:MAG: flippase [Acidobacteriota bacterium]|nr:flippase [Acidobacteriota bacterium]